MKIAVLADRILLVLPAGPLTDSAHAQLHAQLLAELPDWRCLIFLEPGSIVDLRGDPEMTAYANALLERLNATAEPA